MKSDDKREIEGESSIKSISMIDYLKKKYGEEIKRNWDEKESDVDI